MNAYRDLEARFARLLALRDAEAHLHWDMSAMMPPGGAKARAEQIVALKAVQNGLLADPELAELLDRAEADAGALDSWQAANLREMRHIWRHETALDESLVEALSRASSACETAWRTARPANDFATLRPLLDDLLRLVRESAAAKAAVLGCDAYDALLDAHSPGLTTAEVDRLFADLAGFLPGFLARVLEIQTHHAKTLVPAGPFPVPRQRKLAVELMKVLGFDFQRGRLDTSLHPFSSGTPDDARVTTRYDRADFTIALMGVLHETGHALYDAGLPAEWRGQPVGLPRGMDLHESQSLLFEMQACRSRAFVAFAAPMMRAAFDGTGPEWETDNLCRLYTRVTPSPIRVDADEVTYPAHILLRTDLERALIGGTLDLADLPAAWNDGFERLLGIRPPNDRDGCLQDIHWFDGAWGYFPSYTFGALGAAQIFAAATRAEPGIPDAIGQGDFRPLLDWLRAHVHGLGSLLPTAELIERATGAPLGTDAFKTHLEARYIAA